MTVSDLLQRVYMMKCLLLSHYLINILFIFAVVAAVSFSVKASNLHCRVHDQITFQHLISII